FEAGVKPCYVFDGEPPELKSETLEEREERKEEAEEAYEEAKKRGDEAEMLKHAQRATRIEAPQVESSVELLEALNVPWLEAPGEGEAQAAHMSVEGDVDYVGSQDYDALLFGAPELVRNLTVRGRGDRELTPEVLSLDDTLSSLGLSREQLVEVAILVGTDYNEGVHGIGPKTALETVRDGKFEETVEENGVDHGFVESIKSVYLEPEVTDDYAVEWDSPDADDVVDILCDGYDFSEDRVTKAVGRIEDSVTQSSLDRWS
ncbi:MAG: flap structure-specific endonuclease, partial [Halobacteria archaeon]|nr:flap structure-specific endonuclease [Halobacteria archaeon]